MSQVKINKYSCVSEKAALSRILDQACACLISLSSILIVSLYGITLTFAGSVSSEIKSTAELIKNLQSGGHIIYMRHGSTNHSEKDINRDSFEDCSKQRNLSAEGREQVKKIGHAIQALAIPIGSVSSSPYCRCKDTAELVFGEFQVELDLQFSISKDESESQLLGERLYSLMMNTEAGPNNTVFVGHTSNLKDGLGIWPKPEGVVVIFQKRAGSLVYKGMIKPDEWPRQ